MGINPMNWEMGSWSHHVGEHTRGTTEHIVFKFNTLIQRNVVLYAATIANVDIVAHIDILPQRAVVAQHCPTLDVGEVPNLCSLANDHSVIDIA